MRAVEDAAQSRPSRTPSDLASVQRPATGPRAARDGRAPGPARGRCARGERRGHAGPATASGRAAGPAAAGRRTAVGHRPPAPCAGRHPRQASGGRPGPCRAACAWRNAAGRGDRGPRCSPNVVVTSPHRQVPQRWRAADRLGRDPSLSRGRRGDRARPQPAELRSPTRRGSDDFANSFSAPRCGCATARVSNGCTPLFASEYFQCRGGVLPAKAATAHTPRTSSS